LAACIALSRCLCAWHRRYIKLKEKPITGTASGMNEICAMFRAMPGISRPKNALVLADAPNFDERLKASLMA
jgi:hypothetical protein